MSVFPTGIIVYFPIQFVIYDSVRGKSQRALWQSVFGVGLVKTSEDFGVMGDRPTHPELLDWLAVEFIDSGWDVNHLLHLILTSATYRQASHVTPAKLVADPDNRYFTRVRACDWMPRCCVTRR